MTRKIERRDLLKAGVASCAGVAIARAGVANGNADKSDSEESDSPAEPLKETGITHAGIQPVEHPRLGVEVNGQTCIRYLRFRQPIRLDRLELGRTVYGRHVPTVPTHPAHVVVSVLDPDTNRWQALREVDIPPDPRITGEGLSQEMSAEEMEAHFKPLVDEPPHIIAMRGVRTDHLRVVCDREHPVWPNHGECNGGVLNVPFGTLNALKAFGDSAEGPAPRTPYQPLLKQGEIRPEAPAGMEIRELPQMLLFESKSLSVGFSLRRPLLMHLGWDFLAAGQARHNRLLVSRKSSFSRTMGGVSGPTLRTLHADYPAHLWTGEVSVAGNRISYRNLSPIQGLSIDALFTVENDNLILELTQTCAEPMPVIEAEAWRLAWDLKAGITGLAAVPTLKPGRNGDVEFPAILVSDGVGCLTVSLADGNPAMTRLQHESYRFQNCVTDGFVFGSHPGPDACQVLAAGTHHATFKLVVTNLEPQGPDDAPDLGVGLERHWATTFSCFRPEYRGFSNHSASVNCHLSQGPPLEIVTHTRRPSAGPDPLAMARFTIGKALLDGGGYGYYRNLYLDSDPVLISTAGRIHQAGPDLAWLRRIEPGLVEAVERLEGQIGADGLLICRDLSGNSGSYRWSSNSMDVVGFGHIDGYVNAWSYRALRNAAALLDELPKRRELAARCRESAVRLRQAYGPALLNPETGWVAGWRSRDGELHDYAFTWVNGVALAFGLLEPGEAKKALSGLENKRDEVGPSSASLGLPCNLLPIREDDQTLPRIIGGTEPTFETYTDGSLSGWPALYYLRALSIYGLKERALKLATEMESGYAAGVFNGGNGSGHEFRSWEGLPTGYEGTLIGCFGPMYAIAIEKGVLQPKTPEWWPENG